MLLITTNSMATVTGETTTGAEVKITVEEVMMTEETTEVTAEGKIEGKIEDMVETDLS